MRVDDDSVRFWPSEGFHGECGFFSGDRDRFKFGISFRLNFNLHIHVKNVQVLLCFPDDSETLLGAVDHVLQIEFRNAGGMQPLRKKRTQAGRLRGSGGCVAQLEFGGCRLRKVRFGKLLKILDPRGFAGIFRIKILQQGIEIGIADDGAKHVKHHGALVDDHGLIFLRTGLETTGISDWSRLVKHERAHGVILQRLVQGVLARILLDVQSVGITREPVGEPDIGWRRSRDLRAPPLMRNQGCQQSLVRLGLPLPRPHQQQAGSGKPVHRSLRQLRDSQARIGQSAEFTVEVIKMCETASA